MRPTALIAIHEGQRSRGVKQGIGWIRRKEPWSRRFTSRGSCQGGADGGGQESRSPGAARQTGSGQGRRQAGGEGPNAGEAGDTEGRYRETG
jgi:hypothetical protein